MSDRHGEGLTPGEVFQGWLPIIVLIAIVVAWTGPWSKLPSIIALHYQGGLRRYQ